MTLHSVDVPNDLWDNFIKAIDGEFASASEALRSFMRQKVREKNLGAS